MRLKKIIKFFTRQIFQIYTGGLAVLFVKLRYLFYMAYKYFPYVIAMPFLIIIRIISPIFIIRIGELLSPRIGHLAANTELYLCEKDAGINIPPRPYLDIFYYVKPISNYQLLTMWKRLLTVFPSSILIYIHHLNTLIPGGEIHDIGTNSNMDRDIHNLLDQYPQHLKFTDNEERKGIEQLGIMGLSTDSKFVCLFVRDDSYLESHLPEKNWSYHGYRNSDIQNYSLISEILADQGYFVFRVGAKVNKQLVSLHPRIIDYAFNGMRNDFMDIYLGANCEFCISTGAGWDSVPFIFRRPIVYTSYVPLGYLSTFSNKFIVITKHHMDIQEKRELSFSEIFERGVGYCLNSEEFIKKGVEVIENTPEEIKDVVMEFIDRSNGCWNHKIEDEYLQELFWQKFPIEAKNISGFFLHGKIKSKFGANFLRTNKMLLDEK
jgi:putative glycosyltransferase (TIGR04372 family)